MGAVGGDAQAVGHEGFFFDHASEEAVEGGFHRAAHPFVVEFADVGVAGRADAVDGFVHDPAGGDLVPGQVGGGGDAFDDAVALTFFNGEDVFLHEFAQLPVVEVCGEAGDVDGFVGGAGLDGEGGDQARDGGGGVGSGQGFFGDIARGGIPFAEADAGGDVDHASPVVDGDIFAGEDVVNGDTAIGTDDGDALAADALGGGDVVGEFAHHVRFPGILSGEEDDVDEFVFEGGERGFIVVRGVGCGADGVDVAGAISKNELQGFEQSPGGLVCSEDFFGPRVTAERVDFVDRSLAGGADDANISYTDA